MNKALIAALLAGLTTVAYTVPADAQTRIKKNALEKTRWHRAPRQIQIIDDRPIIRDFREAPQQEGSIALPPAPQGFGGSGGGGGGGAMGGGPGSSLPAGGLQMGGPNQGYRTAPGGMGSLPKSGFGRSSNIPARGLGPRNALPSGHTTNRLMGKMKTPTKGVGAGGRARGMSRPTGRSAGNYSGPAASTYSGGYGSGIGSATGGSASRTETSVRGKIKRGSLLRK